MKLNLIIPASYENKLELEATINSLINSKILAGPIDRSKIISMEAKLRKIGKESRFVISVKIGSKEFQVNKKNVDPFVASANAIKSLKRICLENIKPKKHFDTKQIINMSLYSPSVEQLSA